MGGKIVLVEDTDGRKLAYKTSEKEMDETVEQLLEAFPEAEISVVEISDGLQEPVADPEPEDAPEPEPEPKKTATASTHTATRRKR